MTLLLTFDIGNGLDCDDFFLMTGSSNASELADLPDIPLRRRGRPAGDGTSAVASPHELQERRMQANRAAASRSHFRYLQPGLGPWTVFKLYF